MRSKVNGNENIKIVLRAYLPKSGSCVTYQDQMILGSFYTSLNIFHQRKRVSFAILSRLSHALRSLRIRPLHSNGAEQCNLRCLYSTAWNENAQVVFRAYIFCKRWIALLQTPTEQESCAIAKMNARCALYKWIE